METRTTITDSINLTSNPQLAIPIQSNLIPKLNSSDSLRSTLIYLSKTYSNDIWKSPTTTTSSTTNSTQLNHFNTDFKTALFTTIDLLYGYSLTSSTFNTSIQTAFPHLLTLKSCSFSNQTIQLDYDLTNLSNLHDVLLYSPRSIDNNNEKILFIFYQLLKLYKHLHSINLTCSELKLTDIYIDPSYFIKVKLPIEQILKFYTTHLELTNNTDYSTDDIECLEENTRCIEWTLKQDISNIYESYKHLNHQDLANITKKWTENKLSNFDYLLIINSISGRQWGYPYSHPIFPWISDFESLNTKLRDLTVSKFRLNKGDAHLDLTYQASLNSETGPYHVTEFLSEITYYVYKSRVTDKETLCKNVRRTWVPNEYPQSIQRLYQWSPEECIPEFYCDPSIFHTIHPDLPDLKLPSWCPTSEEFIRTHRMLLESDLVSRKLHCWIDLVFGYRLTSEPAFESKNICLPLIDNHQTMQPYGIAQVFTCPHPYKITDKRNFHSEKLPKFSVHKGQSSQVLNEKRMSITKLSDPVNEQKPTDILSAKIHLPEDYNPYLVIDQMELLYKFTNKTYHCLPQTFSQSDHRSSSVLASFEQLLALDLKCLACILTELAFFSKVKCLPQLNTLQTRTQFICNMLLKQPHIIMSGPFAAFILSTLKPFKPSPKQSYFYEAILKSQSTFNNIDTLLNMHLTCLPFKSFFENLHNLCSLFDTIDQVIQEFDELSQYSLKQRLVEVIQGVTSLNINHEDLLRTELQLLKVLNQNTGSDTSTTKCQNDELLIKVEFFHEQKFFLALYNLPELMVLMSDPRKNLTAQSILFTADSFDLIFPHLISFFESPKTCVDAFLYLFNKLSFFLSRTEMIKKFLPILLHVLNVVDLNETIGIDLASSTNEEKFKFTKLFEYTFINELRIIFGIKVFLQQIYPLIIEAVSGLKDFDYDIEQPVSYQETQTNDSNNKHQVKQTKSTNNESQQIFMMDSQDGSTTRPGDDFKPAYSLDDSEELSSSTNSRDTSMNTQKIAYSLNHLDFLKDNNTARQLVYPDLEPGRANEFKETVNISTNAFRTFDRLCTQLGPVLTSKYCCVDLIKMLAICYMNSSGLNQIESETDKSNPLNSVWPVEGDRFAKLILKSLKNVVKKYGEQLIVLQYFHHVANTISACLNRLSLSCRLEGSLIAGVILINYFCHYLEIKLLMENLNFILNQIILPVISLYSNSKIKFPNGSLTRQVLAYKILDIILILSLRIGPEQTRIEMEFTLKTYFDVFSLIRSRLQNFLSPHTRPLQQQTKRIEKPKPITIPIKNTPTTNLISKNAFSRVGSYKTRNSVFGRNQQHSKEMVQSFISTSELNDSIENTTATANNSSDLHPVNSYDDFLKYSYDQSTHEMVSQQVRSNPPNGGKDRVYKYRSHSIGLLSLNDEEEQNSIQNLDSFEGSSEQERSASILEENEVLDLIISSPTVASVSVSPKVDDEIYTTFNSSMAYTAYLNISRLSSGVYIDSILSNTDLIHQMCMQDEKKRQRMIMMNNQKHNKFTTGSPKDVNNKSTPSNSHLSVTGIAINNNNITSSQKNFSNSDSYKSSSSYGTSFSENVSMIGNQIRISQSVATPTTTLSPSDTSNGRFALKFNEQELKEKKNRIDMSCHLTDNWLAYWESEIHTTMQAGIDFKHINLLTLSGHTSAVKCIISLDNESSIISGSKDRTVKLWTIRNQNKVNKKTCQWTYTQHKKPVFGLLFIESLRMCVSCDGSVHVWDPFVGRKLFQLDSNVVTCLSSIAPPSSSFACSTPDNLIKFGDLRSKSYAYEFRTCSAPYGSIKTLTTTPNNLVLVGFSTGLICVVDMRNGWIVGTWKNHDNEILQMKTLTDDLYVVTYSDGTIAIGSIKEKGQLKNVIKVWNEPVPFLTINEGQLIASTSSNKIGIHSDIEDKSMSAKFSLNKLQPENFKGILTCQNYLPLNRLLLLGSDNGDIKLFC